MSIIYIIIGAAVVLWGADKLTDGATAIAQRMNIPQIVIGLTVIAMGTSMPEFFVSLMSAIKGTPGLAVGNVVGSNIFNTMLIVGVAATVAPMSISRNTVRKDLPFVLLASALLTAMCVDGFISRAESAILFILFICFMFYTVRVAKKSDADESNAQSQPANLPIAAFWVFIGLTCLIIGSNIFVSGATDIARSLDISEGVIGLTVVAGGTSLPELATSVVAARKGRSAMAIGNVIGSNVFNILLIIGTTGIILPMETRGITILDLCVMSFSAILLWFFSFTKYTVERWEGTLLATLFCFYIGWLIYNL